MWFDSKIAMAGPDATSISRLKSLGVLGVLVATLSLACASGGGGGGATETPPPPVEEPIAEAPSEPEPVTTSPSVEDPPPIEVLPEVTPDPIEEPQAVVEAASSETGKEPEDESVVVIDTGAKDLTDRPVTLVEAARAERERRNVAPPTDIVITDKNLSEYAQGDLTVAEPADPGAAAKAAELSEMERQRAEDEAFWRSGALEIRQAWRDAYDQVEELEGKVFDLRQQFYREDDGFYRDSEIKPAWDRAIDQLEEARAEVLAKQKELVEFMESGRAAGALPGWLREGIDLEPPTPVETEESAEPTEPVIYEPEASDPP